MFRIYRVYDDTLPINRRAIAEVQEILRAQFPLLSEQDILKLPEQLKNPLKYRFRSILFVAVDSKDRVLGFSLLNHAPAQIFFDSG